MIKKLIIGFFSISFSLCPRHNQEVADLNALSMYLFVVKQEVKALLNNNKASKIMIFKDHGLLEKMCAMVDARVPRKKYFVPFLLRPFVRDPFGWPSLGVASGVTALSGFALFKIVSNFFDSGKKQMGAFALGGIAGAISGDVTLRLIVKIEEYYYKLACRYRKELNACLDELGKKQADASLQQNIVFEALAQDEEFKESFINYLISSLCS